MEQGIEACIRRGVLSDILSRSKMEVRKMLLTEYDEKPSGNICGSNPGRKAWKKACRKESVHLSWIIWKNKFRRRGSFPSWSGDFPLRRNRRRSTLRNMQRDAETGENTLTKPSPRVTLLYRKTAYLLQTL